MIAVIIQARTGSTRLPGKVVKILAGHEVLWHVATRAALSKKIDKVIVATTANKEDDVIENFCRKNNFLYFRGSSENVLERYYLAAKEFGVDTVIRVTSDDPLTDPNIIDMCVEKFFISGADYISNVVPGERTFPRGLDIEVFSFAALSAAFNNASQNYEKEHVTPYIWENKKNEFKIGEIVTASEQYAASYRLAIDYPEDLNLFQILYNRFYKENEIISVPEIIKFLDKNPRIAAINANCAQKPLK